MLPNMAEAVPVAFYIEVAATAIACVLTGRSIGSRVLRTLSASQLAADLLSAAASIP